MAEVNNCPDPSLPSKRLPDPLSPIDLKKPKLDDNNSTTNGNHQNDTVLPQPQPQQQDEYEEDEEDNSIPQPVIDRKGKGILIEEDEEEDDEDDSDSDSDSDSDDSGIGGDELSDDSDFIDDPLAEVNMDNILPSRTRRKTINPQAYLATDLLPEDDSDDSDDPDA